jgi:hypothetical protein
LRGLQEIANHLGFASVRGQTGEVVMRTVMHVSSEVLTALVNIASFSVFIGALAAVYTQSVRAGLVVAGITFASASLGFSYSLWRLYRLRALTPA